MEINASGFTARDLLAGRTNIEQELTQRAQEKEDAARKEPRDLEPRPVEQTSSDKQGRIDIYV